MLANLNMFLKILKSLFYQHVNAKIISVNLLLVQNIVRYSDLVSVVPIRHTGILIALGTPEYLIRIFKQSINENDISISFFIHSLIGLARDFNNDMMNRWRILRI